MEPGSPNPSLSAWLQRLGGLVIIVVVIILAQGRLLRREQPAPSTSPQPATASVPADAVRQQTRSTDTPTPTAAAELPDGLKSTLDRIARGESFPHRDDGTVFGNREGLLPSQPYGYYHEYVHPTPGVRGPGARRVVIGRSGEVYYTSDHYRSFTRLDITVRAPQ